MERYARSMPDFLSNAELMSKLVITVLIIGAAIAGIVGVKGLFRGLKTRVPKINENKLGQGARMAIFGIALFLILNVFISFDTIIATVGAICAMVAVGFVAVWSILCNFLCTLFLVIFKPFSVGDELDFPTDKIGGRVVDITFLFTVLADAEGFHVTIPNSQFFQKSFRRRAGRHTIELSEQIKRSKPVVIESKSQPVENRQPLDRPVDQKPVSKPTESKPVATPVEPKPVVKPEEKQWKVT